MFISVDCIFRDGAVRNGPGPKFGQKPAQNLPKLKFRFQLPNISTSQLVVRDLWVEKTIRPRGLGQGGYAEFGVELLCGLLRHPGVDFATSPPERTQNLFPAHLPALKPVAEDLLVDRQDGSKLRMKARRG